MANTPVASYDNSRLMLNRPSGQGRRGTAGKPAMVTTSTGGTNSNIILFSKKAGLDGQGIKAQFVNLGSWLPLRVYDGGAPAFATLVPGTNISNVNLMARSIRSAPISITLVNPGGTTALLTITVVNQFDIVVSLARASNAITTTPQQLVTALNLDPKVNILLEASLASTNAGILPAIAKTTLTGGSIDPNLVTVVLNTDTSGNPVSTSRQVAQALLGSQLVGSLLPNGSTGNGVVTAMGLTALVGAVQSLGDVEVTNETAEETQRLLDSRRSVSHMKNSDVGMTPRTDRNGTPREMRDITANDRAQYQTTHADTRLQQEHGPRSPYL